MKPTIMPIIYAFTILFLQIEANQLQNTNLNEEKKINIDNFHFQSNPSSIKDYNAVAKIYPQLVMQRDKPKQVQTNSKQKLPKDYLSNNNKQIKWKIGNIVKFNNYVIDELDEQIQLKQSVAKTEAKIENPSKQSQNNKEVKQDIQIQQKKDVKEKIDIKQKSAIDSNQSKKNEQINISNEAEEQSDQNIYKYGFLIVFVISAAIFGVYKLMFKSKKEKRGKKFQYKPAYYNVQSEAKDDQYQTMNQEEFSSVLHISQQEDQ